MRVGEIVNEKYELLSLIGEGGMGAVYEARHTVLNRRFALKFLRSDLVEDKESQTRFLREAQAAASIGSDHIVQVTDMGTAQDGSPYLVMELLEGPDLRQIIGREKIVEPKRAARFTLQLCHALGAAHAQGIIHRDLKPENIIVTQTSERKERLKILDFGIAKFHDLHLTATGSVLGTPQYMAPEQAKGTKNVDHRVDIYAVGAMLYEMLTGEQPFRGATLTAILVKVLTETPRRPREIRPDLPESLELVVLKAMDRDPDQRYESMSIFAKDVLSWSAGEQGVQEEPLTKTPPDLQESIPAGLTVGPNPQLPEENFSPPTIRPGAKGPRAKRPLPLPVIIGAVVIGVLLFVVLSGVGLCGIGRCLCGGSGGTTQIAVMSRVPSGSVTLLDNSGQLTVSVSRPFKIANTEVTQSQFGKVMGYNPSTFSACGGECPVETVSWHEAAHFANKLSHRRGLPLCYRCQGQRRGVRCEPESTYNMPQDCLGLRLPTEVEWELAARGQTTTHTYAGDLQPQDINCGPSGVLHRIAWFSCNSGNHPWPVKSLSPNAFGLQDMLGNVWEWCHDVYRQVAVLPQVPIDRFQKHRVVRGGAFDSDPLKLRSSYRGFSPHGKGNPSTGFRVAKSVKRR